MSDESHAQIRRIAERFTQLNDIPVRIILERDLPGVYLSAPQFARYHAWDLLPQDVDKLIYFDTDILPMRKLPPLPDVDLAAVPDCKMTTDFIYPRFPLLKQFGKYFSSGFMIATRRTLPIFRRVLARQMSGEDKYPWLNDQTLMNVESVLAIQNGEITFKLLSKRWACMPVHHEPTPDPYMMHFTGVPDQKLRIINYLLEYAESIEDGLGGIYGA